MMQGLLQRYRKLPPMAKYLAISVFVTVIDTAVVWILSMQLSVNLTAANTAGVIVGQIIHYSMASGQVFDMEFGPIGAVIYFGTFVLGLLLANWIITTAFSLSVELLGDHLAFLFAKGCSIVGPFFALYFLRKFLYGLVKRRKNQ